MTELVNGSITDFLNRNEHIYGVVNKRHYNPVEMLPFLGGYGGRFLKAVRLRETIHLNFWLANATSWLFGLSNKLEIPLEIEAWNRYHGVCPYCKSFPCRGSVTRPCKSMEIIFVTPTPWKNPPNSFSEFQRMLKEIYPFNTLESSTQHVAEEIFELQLEVTHFVKTNDLVRLDNVKEEVADVLANFCAVASCLNQDLAESIATQFSEGCPDCRHESCTCGYSDAKIV